MGLFKAHLGQFEKDYARYTEAWNNRPNLQEIDVHTLNEKEKETLFKDFNEADNNLNQSLKFIVEESSKNNIYFPLCLLETYKNTYDDRLSVFLDDNLDSTEIDFIEDELIQLQDIIEIQYPLIEDDVRYIINTRKKYLKQQKQILKGKPIKVSRQLTPYETIYLLQEVGVISLLEDKYNNNSKLSTLLNLITDKNSKNLKTSIERLNTKQSSLGTGYLKSIEKVYKIIKANEL